jgi:hypothetical protein
MMVRSVGSITNHIDVYQVKLPNDDLANLLMSRPEFIHD